MLKFMQVARKGSDLSGCDDKNSRHIQGQAYRESIILLINSTNLLNYFDPLDPMTLRYLNNWIDFKMKNAIILEIELGIISIVHETVCHSQYGLYIQHVRDIFFQFFGLNKQILFSLASCFCFFSACIPHTVPLRPWCSGQERMYFNIIVRRNTFCALEIGRVGCRSSLSNVFALENFRSVTVELLTKLTREIGEQHLLNL